MWHGIRQRVGNANGKNPSYASVELRMTQEAFLQWVIPAYKRFIARYPLLIPSIDRCDTTGHYEIGNLRILALGDNAMLATNKRNVHAPEGMAWCTKCKAYLPRSSFHKNRAQSHGLQHTCKLHRRKRVTS